MTRLSVITPCYNEEANVRELCARVAAAMARVPDCTYEHILIDNASSDNTVAVLRDVAAADRRVKIIVNARNFGHIRSPMHAFLAADGEAVISIVADLQDPPEMIPELVEQWRAGYKVVVCTKRSSEEDPLMFWIRKFYYRVVERLSAISTIQNFTGFGLYDRQFVEAVRRFGDPYPYFRGMVSEIGLSTITIPYDQPVRRRGVTSNNFYALYDMAMLGITNLSKVPLRLVTGLGFVTALGSLLTGIGYLLYKLVFWRSFDIGIAPMVIGLFFLGAVQLVSIGIIGEYVGAIHTQVQKRPYVIEKERIGF
ncbi:glycosyltransferase family 2 protein [Acidocella sp.]|uniref:glycosyltransferase family 2 protein n=1 Tax=Acidocella sp. TaxID=50710 RepID=UPI0026186AEE|nr:glycosyltransferase family 2 protein [Acidocella sp.]